MALGSVESPAAESNEYEWRPSSPPATPRWPDKYSRAPRHGVLSDGSARPRRHVYFNGQQMLRRISTT